MTDFSTDVLDSGKTRFWDQFESVVPEAVRCRFFSTATRMADARATEYRRESGPFLAAVESNHLPRAIRRLNTLKKDAEALVTFYEDNDHLIARTAGLVEEAFKVIVDFETQIVRPLDEAAQRRDEAHAREVIKSLSRASVEIARSAENSFARAVGDLEKAVVQSVTFIGSLTGFVSCVSVDLAQYGAHAKVLHDYSDAKGVFTLNQKIHEQIDHAIAARDIPREEVIKIDTGDGAILIFTSLGESNGEKVVADRAFRFSNAFLKAIAEGNHQKDAENQLHFRIGICSGVIALEQARVRQSEIARCRAGGVPLGSAVRLQAAARTGEIVACATTWMGFPKEVQAIFSQAEPIYGKIHEKTPIQAHRFECVPPRPEERDNMESPR